MYLDVADSASLPYGWSRYAQFSLAVVNQIHSKYSVRKGVFSNMHMLQYTHALCFIIYKAYVTLFLAVDALELSAHLAPLSN